MNENDLDSVSVLAAQKMVEILFCHSEEAMRWDGVSRTLAKFSEFKTKNHKNYRQVHRHLLY